MNAVFVKQGKYDKGDAAFPVVADAVRRFLLMSGRADADISAVTPGVIVRTPEKRPVVLMNMIRTGIPGGAASETSDLDISVTHSGDIWMCLVSDARCGADFQYMRERVTYSIVSRYFTEGESGYIDGGAGRSAEPGSEGEEERAGRFFDIWVRREALGKYEGHGFFGDYPDSAPGGTPAESVFFIGENTEESRRVYIREITAEMLSAAGIRPSAEFRSAAVTESDEPLLIVDISQPGHEENGYGEER